MAALSFDISINVKWSKFSRRHIQFQRTVADASNLFYMVSDFFKHFADLPVATLDQRYLVPRIIRFTHDADQRGTGLYAPSAFLHNLHTRA